MALTEEEHRPFTPTDEHGSDWCERRRAGTALLLDWGKSAGAVVVEQKSHKEAVANWKASADH